MDAHFKCDKCSHEWDSIPGPTQCPKCHHLYVKWVNYDNWLENLPLESELKQNTKQKETDGTIVYAGKNEKSNKFVITCKRRQ